MSVVTLLYFQILEENNYMFRPFSVWAIIRLRLEYRRKFIHYNADIKYGGTSSRLYIYIYIERERERELHSSPNIVKRDLVPHTWCPHCSIWIFSDILVLTWWWPTQKRAETCSCFPQQFENTVVLRRTFIHSIPTSISIHHLDL
jgi:hypothetical protein